MSAARTDTGGRLSGVDFGGGGGTKVGLWVAGGRAFSRVNDV